MFHLGDIEEMKFKKYLMGEDTAYLIEEFSKLEIGKSEIGKKYKQGNEYFICQRSYDRCKGCYFLYEKCPPECNECCGKGYIYKKLEYFEVLFNKESSFEKFNKRN